MSSRQGEAEWAFDPWKLRLKGLILFWYHPTRPTEKAIIKLANAS